MYSIAILNKWKTHKNYVTNERNNKVILTDEKKERLNWVRTGKGLD